MTVTFRQVPSCLRTQLNKFADLFSTLSLYFCTSSRGSYEYQLLILDPTRRDDNVIVSCAGGMLSNSAPAKPDTMTQMVRYRFSVRSVSLLCYGNSHCQVVIRFCAKPEIHQPNSRLILAQ